MGLAEFHLGGRHCSPPVKKIIAGFSPLEVDRQAAKLLGLDWKKIPHLAKEILTKGGQEETSQKKKEWKDIINLPDDLDFEIH